MITDYDDDTHFCIKCHATILGLDNYVSHRKSNCGKSIHVEELPKSPLPSQLLPPDESFSLKADDFFSSLELQSSSKKIASHSTTGKNLSRILTRSKASAVIQANNANKDVDIQPSKSGKNAWIGGHQLKELGTGDNQTKLIKAVDNLTRSTALKKVEESNLHTYEDTDDDSDDYYYDDESDLEDQQSGPPRSHTGGKWKPSSSPVEWSVNRDWNPPPINFTGGKWKPSRRISPPPNQNKEFTSGKWIPSKSSPKREDQNKDDDRDWNSPPINFTGGKWKPCKRNSPPPSHTKGKWKPESPSYDTPKPSFTGGKWTSSKSKIDEQIKDDDSKWGDYVTGPAYDYPPPGHTKGKWKPSGLQEIHRKSHVEAPPPTHTEGKWLPTDKQTKSDTATASTSYSIIATDLPPFRKSNGRVQYWCGPCNRRLASKIVYERHLRSDLHMKRTRRNSDEFDDSSHLNTNNATESKKNKKPVEYWSNTDTANNEDTMKNAESRSKRIRSRTFIKCQVCRSRVHKHLMGKHLISHYHCRKGDITIPTAREMVLENIYSIVLQSPYQCATCRFYCNTQDDFLTHWCSTEHITNVERYEGLFWCSFCKHEASLTSKMLDHLLSEEHNEVISAINRSVPIVIRKINPTKCETCDATFLLNIQLRKHCEHEGHPFSNTSSDIYQNKHFCDMCADVFKSRIALQRHKKTKHGRHEYMCSVCGLNFESLLEAKMHRQTKEHRYANETKMGKMVPEKKITKECQHCKRKFERMTSLKQHLKIDHPEHKHSCPRCGITFIIPQELSVHLRTKSCNFNQTPEKQNKCDRCPYSTESESELLFHIVLHGEPLIFADDKCKKGSRPVEKYKCPFCQKFFAKLSLRCHIRLHTKERPYVCTGCGASFVRKNNWALHTKNCGREKTNQKKQASGRDIAESSYLCSTCGASFKKKSILQLHMTRHTGKLFKCPTDGCIFSARTHAELQPHLITHSDLKPFACTECDYKGKTKKQLVRHLTAHAETKKYKCSRCPFTTRLSSHLKRHMRLHTGAKPFSCPHCTYRCNNMENLRKHVLSSNRHPGKCIYECKFCPGSSFGSNFARDFKVHLIAEHPDVFHSGSHAATYITGIYEAAEDPVFVDTASNQEVKSSDNSAKVTDIYQLEFHKHIPITAVSTATTSTQLLNTENVQECVVESKGGEELFPMYVVAKDEEVVCVENPSDSWSMVGSYDVEESGALVPFNSDGETLFQEHFQ